MSLADTLNAIKTTPAAAHTTITVSNDLVGATTVRVGARQHTFSVDEPEALGGSDAAASPLEYVLAALGSCQAITYKVWAAQLGIQLDTVSVEVDGDLDMRGFFGLDRTVRPGFKAVRLRVKLGGPEPRERYLALAEAVDKHCPVLDIFRNTVQVERDTSVG